MASILIGGKEKELTIEALAALKSKDFSELIDGELIENMPTGHLHAQLELFLGALIMVFVMKNNLGRTFSGEVGIIIRRNPDTVRAADLAYMSHARFEKVQSKSYLDIAPELVIEIMSPDDRWSAVNAKLADYFEIDVREVWLVDPQRSVVHLARKGEPLREMKRSQTLESGLLPGFEIKIDDLFAQKLPNSFRLQ